MKQLTRALLSVSLGLMVFATPMTALANTSNSNSQSEISNDQTEMINGYLANIASSAASLEADQSAWGSKSDVSALVKDDLDNLESLIGYLNQFLQENNLTLSQSQLNDYAKYVQIESSVMLGHLVNLPGIALYYNLTKSSPSVSKDMTSIAANSKDIEGSGGFINYIKMKLDKLPKTGTTNFSFPIQTGLEKYYESNGMDSQTAGKLSYEASLIPTKDGGVNLFAAAEFESTDLQYMKSSFDNLSSGNGTAQQFQTVNAGVQALQDTPTIILSSIPVNNPTSPLQVEVIGKGNFSTTTVQNNNTTYVSSNDAGRMLTMLGYKNQSSGAQWNITTSKKITVGKTIGTGTQEVTINGNVVMKYSPLMVGNQSYISLPSLQSLFNQLSIKNTKSGSSFILQQ